MRKTVVLALLASASAALAQPGSLDPTFADAGIHIMGVNQTISSGTDILALEDNTMLIVGTTYANDTIRGAVVHFLNDGSIDQSFGENGSMVITAGASTVLNAITMAADGSYLVAGMVSWDTENAVLLAKFLSNGELDASFGVGGLVISDLNGASGRLNDLHVQDDGRIVACGWTLDGNLSTNGLLMRFTADGVLDQTFSSDGILVNTMFFTNDALHGITVLDDGNILSVGSVNLDNTTKTLLLECDASGALDMGFGEDGIVIPEWNATQHEAMGLVSSGNAFLVCGYIQDVPENRDAFVARFVLDGSLDSIYGVDGLTRLDTTAYDGALDIVLDALGNAVLCGYAGTGGGSLPRDVLVARIAPDGNGDMTFGANGSVITSASDGWNEGVGLAIQPDARIIVTGQAVLQDTGFILVARYLSDACAVFPSVSPESPILCPTGTGELTTGTFDTYQWYKNGAPIPGATSQALPVTSADDAGSWFKVETSIDTCSAISDSVLVDSYVFLLPFISNEGDAPNLIGDNGEQIYCQGDDPVLVLGAPFDTNVQWSVNGEPIAGANDTLYAVSGSGNYTVEGAPSVCPDFIQDAGVTIAMDFHPYVQPAIYQTGILLCPEPEGISAQWYYNGNPVAGLDQCVIPIDAGNYTVFVDYGDSCSVLSAPFTVVGLAEHTRSDMKASPVPTSDRVTITWTEGGPLPDWRVIDVTGRIVNSGTKATSPLTIDLGALDVGRYRFLSGDGRSLPLVVRH